MASNIYRVGGECPHIIQQDIHTQYKCIIILGCEKEIVSHIIGTIVPIICTLIITMLIIKIQMSYILTFRRVLRTVDKTCTSLFDYSGFTSFFSFCSQTTSTSKHHLLLLIKSDVSRSSTKYRLAMLKLKLCVFTGVVNFHIRQFNQRTNIKVNMSKLFRCEHSYGIFDYVLVMVTSF